MARHLDHAYVKITIVGGAGGVGASVAFNLLLAPGEHEVVLVDRRPEMVTSHAMDLEQVLTWVEGGSVRGGDSHDCLDADVLVVTAAVPLTLNTSRNVFLAGNAAILREVMDPLPATWPGILLLVTNPVDPLLTWAQQRSGFDRRRVLGYTVNDSLRLRTGIAKATGAAPGAVDAWTIGEHGELCAPLWDRVTIDGAAVHLTEDQREVAEAELRTWYRRHVALDSGRTSTWTSGLGVARMVLAMTSDSGELWPASLVLAGEYGQAGVALSVPVVLGCEGARSVEEWTVAPPELAMVTRAAENVRALTAQIDGLLATANAAASRADQPGAVETVP